MTSRSPRRSSRAAAILLLSLGLCLWIAAAGRTGTPSGASAGHWLTEARRLAAEHDPSAAIEACRAGLVSDPWNPDLCLTLTRLHLEQADPGALRLWMDELVMGDPRQADQLFQLPEFEPWLTDPEMQSLKHEAWRQARD